MTQFKGEGDEDELEDEEDVDKEEEDVEKLAGERVEVSCGATS